MQCLAVNIKSGEVNKYTCDKFDIKLKASIQTFSPPFTMMATIWHFQRTSPLISLMTTESPIFQCYWLLKLEVKLALKITNKSKVLDSFGFHSPITYLQTDTGIFFGFAVLGGDYQQSPSSVPRFWGGIWVKIKILCVWLRGTQEKYLHC